MTKKKKTGNARTIANRKQSRQGGRTIGGVHSGTAQDEHRLTMENQRKLFEMCGPSVSFPFDSIGMRSFRIQFINWEPVSIGKQSWMRLVSDTVCCYTKEEAMTMYERLKGSQSSEEFRKIRQKIEQERQRDNLVKFPG